MNYKSSKLLHTSRATDCKLPTIQKNSLAYLPIHTPTRPRWDKNYRLLQHKSNSAHKKVFNNQKKILKSVTYKRTHLSFSTGRQPRSMLHTGQQSISSSESFSYMHCLQTGLKFEIIRVRNDCRHSQKHSRR